MRSAPNDYRLGLRRDRHYAKNATPTTVLTHVPCAVRCLISRRMTGWHLVASDGTVRHAMSGDVESFSTRFYRTCIASDPTATQPHPPTDRGPSTRPSTVWTMVAATRSSLRWELYRLWITSSGVRAPTGADRCRRGLRSTGHVPRLLYALPPTMHACRASQLTSADERCAWLVV